MYQKKYFKYKTKYLKLNNMQRGGNTSNNMQHECSNNDIINKLDKMIEYEFANLKTITFDDLCDLVCRVYERDNKNEQIKNIQYIPKKVNEYASATGWDAIIYVEKKLANIYNTPLKNLMFDFKTTKEKVRLCFVANIGKRDAKVNSIEISLPIKFTTLIEKIFELFDAVGLEGYPDNGGIDDIKYDQENDIYKIHTWS